MSSPARGPAKLHTIYSMNWFLRSPASPRPQTSHHVKYFLLCSSDIDWLQIFPVKYFWSVCALNIFYLSAMIELWPPVWRDGVFYWAQRILDKLSAGSAVTKFRYKLTIEMSPATSHPTSGQHGLTWPVLTNQKLSAAGWQNYGYYWDGR